MFERFTDRARSVVVLAQEESRLLHHNYIGTEHILLGLVREGQGVAAKALENLGISLDAVRARVREIIDVGGAAPSGHIPFTPRAKKVLELSLREALQLAHNYIGTEHILLGLIREGEGVAAQVLTRMGAHLPQVRQEVIQLLSGYSMSVERAAGPASGGETPATTRALEEARRLAGGGPLGTHDVLRAILGDTNSLAARMLAELGVSPEAFERLLTDVDRAGTSDELPEEAGARTVRVEVVDDGVAVVLADAELGSRMARALERQPPVLRSGDPASEQFPSLWFAVHQHLLGIAARLEREAAIRWRPKEFKQPWQVAAYAVFQRPGGPSSYLEVAEGADRNEVRAALGAWLTGHQPRNVHGVTYLAVLVDREEQGGLAYRLSHGTYADFATTDLQLLVAHAIFDLTGQAGPVSQ